ncbi:hypothetical protein BU24DRAFT_420431 [Aaosphaeria arxii CBS 175.79]|uniref:Uncharacterized protein n=1 Tax=Aaosphaeria arxii CBS 175.79 TaxID=1450172 RepID=A0A6A5XVN6_9PLEO|nr:uncharacterized protein BU24DRAFT_420431 [Aaosphaeria arxii CBS 175.79]KAF2017378.1 hypothetical protein BU24DRAFT_420431 [Aaosphaeria arxii CBS 175.79]
MELRQFFKPLSLNSNVWAVYGVVTVAASTSSTAHHFSSAPTPTPDHRTASMKTPSIEQSLLFPYSLDTSDLATTLLSKTRASGPWPTSLTSYKNEKLVANPTPISTINASEKRDSEGMSVGVKVGIGLTLGVLASALAFWLIFDSCYLRRKRRERAMMNAVEEVVRADIQESQERIVLESRVSIVFNDDTASEEVNVDMPRNGMSLPRRDRD